MLILLLTGCGGGPRGRIAYVGSQGDLFTVRPDGGDVRQLTHRGGPEGAATRSAHAWPTWSPDGGLIAATRVDGESSSGGVYALPAGGGEPTLLFAAEGASAFFSAWSPDSRWIAVLAREADGVGLHVRRAEGPADGRNGPAHGRNGPADGRNGPADGRSGTEGRRLLVGDPLYLAWRPDSRALIAHVDGDAGDAPSARVMVVPADGTAAARLAALPNAFRAPAIVKDGRTAVLGLVGPDGRGEVAALDVDGGGARTLLAGGYSPSFVLSPRGDRLAASRQVAGARGVLDGIDVVEMATGEVTRWHSGAVVAFFWSPDGSRLAWAAVDWSEVELQWHVADGPGRGRKVAAFVPSLELGSTLAFFDQYAPTTGVWSPDSRALVFAGWVGDRVDGPSRIWIADAVGEESPRPVGDGVMASWSPR